MVQIIINNVTAWDTQLCLKIFRLNGKKLIDVIMFWASRLGDGYLYAAIALFMLLFNRSFALQFLPAAVIAFTVELVIHGILKHKTKRNRPFEKLSGVKFLIKPPDKFSFPSGHTAAAFLMATLFVHFVPVLGVPFYLLAALIGFSRVYNGLHFPTDVAAGMALGIISAHFGLLIV